MFEIDLAGFDLGIIQQLLDQREQGVAGGFHGPRIGRLLGRQWRVQQQPAHADDAVERRANFVGSHREKPRLGPAGGVGLVAGFAERAFGLRPVGDIAANALHLRGRAGVGSNQAFAPCDPARPDRGCDPLVVDPRAVALQRAVALPPAH